MDDSLTEKSKFLSLLLRHDPGVIGLRLDENGWANIADMLALAEKAGHDLSLAAIRAVVGMSDNNRFELSEDETAIRATFGHSIKDIAIQRTPQTPPDVLFHGTAKRFLASIESEGIQPRERQHVHLSESDEQAMAKGKRYGSPLVLRVHAKSMHQNGFLFYKAANGAWLTDSVPVGCFEVVPTTH